MMCAGAWSHSEVPKEEEEQQQQGEQDGEQEGLQALRGRAGPPDTPDGVWRPSRVAQGLQTPPGCLESFICYESRGELTLIKQNTKNSIFA